LGDFTDAHIFIYKIAGWQSLLAHSLLKAI
jgi:hypothetical protein